MKPLLEDCGDHFVVRRPIVVHVELGQTVLELGAVVSTEERIRSIAACGRDDLMVRELGYLKRHGWELHWIEGTVPKVKRENDEG